MDRRISRGALTLHHLAVSSRRQFLRRAAACGVFSPAALRWAAGPARAAETLPKVPAFALTVIAGNPRERGRRYGEKFKDDTRSFFQQEIDQAFTGNPAPREDLLRYGAACAAEINRYSREVMDELEGLAEGTGLRLEDVVLLQLHEELFHRGKLPASDAAAAAAQAQAHGHCTVLAAGPPDTADGQAYVGQTWDWMTSTYGRSSMLRWERTEGPSVLAYAYPGLWVGAAVNSAGLGFGWTSAWDKEGIAGPRVGIPSYVLLAHMMYQDSLDAAVEEVKRAKPAGWFTVVLADGEGGVANFESSPKELAVERGRGTFARHAYGTRRMTGTAEGERVKHTDKCRRMLDLLAGAKGKLDRATLQRFLHDPAICVAFNPGNFTVDHMLFNTTKREAYVKRGPAGPEGWKSFGFDDVK